MLGDMIGDRHHALTLQFFQEGFQINASFKRRPAGVTKPSAQNDNF
jgi:hypothetical protein